VSRLRDNAAFWARLEELVGDSKIVVDRAKGTEHPDWPGAIYPLDYGYLEATTGGDGHPVDVWLGGGDGRAVTGIVCTLDLHKKDLEIKVLLGCSAGERETILSFHNVGPQVAALVERAEPGETVKSGEGREGA
jgi:inorganic pyrophosphatase